MRIVVAFVWVRKSHGPFGQNKPQAKLNSYTVHMLAIKFISLDVNLNKVKRKRIYAGFYIKTEMRLIN